jgi:proline dehydrogenase
MAAQTLVKEEPTIVEEMVERPRKPKSIANLLPERLVLALAKPYLAGQSAYQALEMAHNIYNENGFSSTLDILGEDMQNDDDCEASVLAYQNLVDSIAKNPLKCPSNRQQMTISMKPSMFSTMAPKPGEASRGALDLAFDRINRVVEYGLKHKVNMTLEAEDHRWTNFQLEAYFALINAGYTNLGTVLQSRLFRTAQDIKRFDSRMRVRMVIGIYNEPAQIAHVDKKIMKARVVEYAQQLLSKGAYVEIASHDENCINHFLKDVVVPGRISAHSFEFQFLQGVPRRKMQERILTGQYFDDLKASAPASASDFIEHLQNDGGLIRMYLPFGTAEVSGAYCRRRLMENPNMITYGIKNLFGIK